MTTIEFDSVDLTADPYFIRQFLHDSWPKRRFEMAPLSRSRGSIVLDDTFGEKVFSVAGKLVASSQSALEDAIDDMKELLSRRSKNLDVSYGSGTRRYVAYVEDLVIGKDYYQITNVDFSFKFVVPSGVGYNPSQQNYSSDNQTSASITGSFSVGGSTYAEGQITISFDSATSCTQVEVTVAGVKITIASTFSAADVLVIDCERKRVTKNGVEIDFTGRFPRFEVGSNSYQIDITRTAAQVDIDFDWYDTYL